LLSWLQYAVMIEFIESCIYYEAPKETCEYICLSRAHDLISRAHDLLDFLNCAHDLLSKTHDLSDLVIRAHDLSDLVRRAHVY